MISANYHTHTIRCKHAVGEEREYIEAAISEDFKILGFSDHTPQPYPTEIITIIIYMCRFIYMQFRLYLYWWLLS